jgi:hypothetical protein
MFALLANGGPAPFPQAASSPWEWVIWGGCLSMAAVLGGWALLHRNRPSRDTPVGVAVLLAFVLVGGATMFAVSSSHARQMEQNRREREELERPERMVPSR